MTYGPVDSPDMPKALGPYSPAVSAGDHLFSIDPTAYLG